MSTQRQLTAIVKPGPQRLDGLVYAQPSKNYTTRCLLAAALARGTSCVRNVARSEDSRAMQDALRLLGAQVELQDEAARLDARVEGFGSHPVLATGQAVNPGNAGAVLRFLLAVGALLPDAMFVTDRPDSLGKRPNGDLLDALEQLGCLVESHEGCLPIRIRGGELLHGGTIRISGARSSQFLSGLLFLAPLVGQPVEIEVVDGLVSKAPVRQTLEILARAGVAVEATDDLLHFTIAPQQYAAGDCTVNGDWPGSAALLAAAAATGSSVGVRGLFDDNQGERLAADALAAMGAEVVRTPGDTGMAPAVTVRPGEGLRGIEFDGDLATDAVLALLGPACVADGRSRFFNISNLRIKECDRISEPIAELRRVGVRCWEGRELGDPDPDAIVIEGSPGGYEGGVEVDGRKDHRVIMLLCIVGLCCRQGLTINGAEHVAKSYPAFFDHMRALGADIELREAT